MRAAEEFDKGLVSYGRNLHDSYEQYLIYWMIAEGLKPYAVRIATPCTELGRLGTRTLGKNSIFCVVATQDICAHQAAQGYLASVENPVGSMLFKFPEWIKEFGEWPEPKDKWEYVASAGCQHNLTSPDMLDQNMAIEKRQIWMSNFSLRPLALECRTLTKTKLDQGACWSLCGCSHKHRHAQGSARLECGTTIKMAQYSGKYTNPMSELYARCLAKALLDNSLIDQTRDKTKESEMTRKMSRHTLKE